ncbi:MAG: amidohydrolase family protein [Chloroflexi bacterium]|nr:amidohydrolase family protein [Chloroflexota bacterium]
MIVDANCHIGHWPFRRLWTATADGLLGMLDRAGVDRAIVSHTHGVFYRSPHESNAELHEAVEGHRDRLIPFACLNPDYAGWRDDLKQCVEEWGMRGLRLYPTYHRYALAGDGAAELLAEAERLNLPVSVSCAFEDRRQRHHLDTAPDLAEHDIDFAVHRHPNVRFLITTAPITVIDMVVRHVAHQGNVCFDTSSITGPLSDSIQTAYELLGPNRLLLGTLAPFEYPEVALLRVQFIEAEAQGMENILGRNALRLVGEEPSP